MIGRVAWAIAIVHYPIVVMGHESPAAPVPSPATPPPGITVVVDPRAKGNARAETQQRSSYNLCCTWLCKNDLGIVLRHINNLRIRGLDHYHLRATLVLHLHGLLLIAIERPQGICLLTETLHRIHDRRLIRSERLPDGGKVVDVLRHHVQDLRKINERNESRIKALRLRRIRARLSAQPHVLAQPVVNIEDLLRIC